MSLGESRRLNRRFRAFSRGLDNELRHRVLSQRFTESQRQELERWMTRPQFQFFQRMCLAKHLRHANHMQRCETCHVLRWNAASRHHTTSIPAGIFRARQRKKAPVSNPQCTTDIYKIRQHENIDVCRKFTFFSICSVKKTSVLTYFVYFFSLWRWFGCAENHSMRFQGFKSE